MAAVALDNKGFSLAEVLAAAGILAMAAAFLVPSYGKFKTGLLNLRAEYAAQRMADDIAALQQHSFYDNSGKSRLEMDKDKGGYCIYYGKSLYARRRFDENDGLYFNQYLGSLKFSVQGAPSSSDNNVKTLNYIIKCRYDQSISKWLQVQPVTGRVVFK